MYKDAIQTFNVVTKNSSNREYLHAAWNGKSQCYRMLRNPKREIECINKALSYKITREVLQNKLLYFETMGKPSEAQEIKKQLKDLSPKKAGSV